MQESRRTLLSFIVQKINDHTPSIRELELKCLTPDRFKFKAGQFVMLHVPIPNEKPALRAYSIASSDLYEDGFNLIFKFVENGKASNYVWSLKGTEILNFTGPFGKVFFKEPPSEQIILLNTGSGIAQHLSYLYSKKNIYPNLTYRMLIGLRSEADIYYERELVELKKELPNFDYQFTLSRPLEKWRGLQGYVQQHLHLFDYQNIKTTFYLCGNSGMIKEAKRQLLEVDGLSKDSVWSEAFD